MRRESRLYLSRDLWWKLIMFVEAEKLGGKGL